jgi:hypothetical protein
MLIQSGDVAALAGLPWVALELTSEARTDEVVLHLTRWAVRNLESEGKAFQLLYPVESRSLAGPELMSPYLWMRVSDHRLLARVTSIMGLQGMVTDASGATILTDPAFVDSLIARVRAASDAWSAGIEVGSGVSVLLGSAHGLRGTVESLHTDGSAEVRIALRSRAVRLRIPVRALARLSSAPKDYFEKEEL